MPWKNVRYKPMRIIDEQEGTAADVRLLTPAALHDATGKHPSRILALLAEHPNGLHAAEIARRLKEPEQNVHYHLRKLRKAGAIVIDRVEDTAGAAAKMLRLQAPALAVAHAAFKPWTPKPATDPPLLVPFIRHGAWNARIVVSSPDPHGPESARGRDAGYAIDLGLLLGRHCTTAPGTAMQFDTDAIDWNANLIVIGGPVVNKVAQQLNAASPIAYDTERKAFLLDGKHYAQDNAGIIVKMPNPKAKGKWVILLAGKRYTGTRAAILAFIQRFDEIGAMARPDGSLAVVVEGLDADSDGDVESVRVLDRQA